MNDNLIPKKRVMEILKIDRRTFENLVKYQNLPCIKVTEYKRFIRESHFERWLDSQTINLPSETT